MRLLVAGPPGASADLIARLLGEALGTELGQVVNVEPRPGAAGLLAAGELIRAPHDGQTLLVGVNSLVSEIPHIVKSGHDLGRELRPLAELARGGLVLVGHPSLPARNLAELVAWIKARPSQVSVASYSRGTMSHVLGRLFNQALGTNLQRVGYKGSTPRRMAVLPEVPTFTELGLPRLQAVGWMGLWCTPDLPAAAQARLRAATLKVLAQPGLHERLLALGFEAGTSRTPEEMGADLRADFERVGAVLKSVGFKPD
ncbi:Bug family tripartite tricarboxylate transporter substrate binding protein [Roseateles saccharophilus]|uniref:Tripartite-type tricarboxylate transporter receptor subunit TctC n=1 Tax=Roseateles saccharophilus TaxID=304 RepID=A0A4R3VDD9_ROSSA|nr:tripartite tricarboxylate transporter substrate binding protein [Roseateles saccharophilus]MDG0834763.1 tripartite tricarboxylate transporter substrate binding protein [Roseateles saccharophilus]TCV03357.1 tripartite-type tricarboxylate transporter receptor subunit TctC [Roseateles saccharophilus]